MTHFYEGFIAPDTHPIAYAAAERIDMDTRELNQRAQTEPVTIEEVMSVMSAHNGEIIKAIAKLEHQLGVQAGDIVEM